MQAVATALLPSLTSPTLTFNIDLTGANFSNCCNRTNSDDNRPMILSGNTLKPESVWQRVFCCCSKSRVQEQQKGKDAVREYYLKTYGPETATDAFKSADVDFDAINAISVAQSRKIAENVLRIWQTKTQNKHAGFKQKIEQIKPDEVAESKEDDEAPFPDESLPEILSQQKRMLCETLKKARLKTKISDKKIEEIVINAISNAVNENRANITPKRLQDKVFAELKKEGCLQCVPFKYPPNNPIHEEDQPFVV